MLPPPKTLCRLRLLVAFLGQRGLGDWWATDFLSESGRQLLAYNFQRQPLLAGFTATCAAAKRLHDERIGRHRTYHLFRLPAETEVEVHAAAAADHERFLTEFPLTQRDAMADLGRIAVEAVDAPEGPVQVGGLDEVVTERGILEMARHYHSGFQRGLVTLPYFASRGR